MTEAQIRLFPAFKKLPVYDESDCRSHSVALRDGRKVRECSTLAEVEACLKNPSLMPVGAVRCGLDGQQVVVVYFVEK